MKAYVGVTDQRWYEFLAARPHVTEVNFWLPGGGVKHWGATRPGEPFIFKTHRPHDRLVGGGFLSDYRRLPLSVAWQNFGIGNGAESVDEMRQAVFRYRPGERDRDPVIGCVMLRDVSFCAPSQTLAPPADFAPNIVRGKTYEIDELRPGSSVELAFARLLAASPAGLEAVDLTYLHEGPMYGRPRMVAPRLGQRAFAAVVQSAYGLRCAVTGDKIRPALQAAHIRPVASAGQHRVDNGLLLRADVHILFDEGFLGVHPERRELMVSSRLRADFGNGEEFYALTGQPIGSPARAADRPNADFLQWHADEVFDRAP